MSDDNNSAKEEEKTVFLTEQVVFKASLGTEHNEIFELNLRALSLTSLCACGTSGTAAGAPVAAPAGKRRPSAASPKSSRSSRRQGSATKAAAATASRRPLSGSTKKGHALGDCVIHALAKLRSVDVSNNALPVLQGLDANTQLRKIVAFNNKIESCRGLGQLRLLEVLQLQSNRITSFEQIAGLTTLANLTELRVDGNQLTSTKGLEGLRNLEVLDVSNNAISKFEELNKLPKLVELHAGYNQLTDLRDLPKTLRELHADHNSISEFGDLRNLNALQEVHLAGNRLGDASWEKFPVLPALTELDLADNAHIHRIQSEVLKRCSELQILDVSDCPIETIEMLSLPSSIVELSVHGTPFSEQEKARSALLTAYPQLEIINGESVEIPMPVQLPSRQGARPGSAMGGRPVSAAGERPPTAGAPAMRPLSARQAADLVETGGASFDKVASHVTSFREEMTLRHSSAKEQFQRIQDTMNSLGKLTVKEPLAADLSKLKGSDLLDHALLRDEPEKLSRPLSGKTLSEVVARPSLRPESAKGIISGADTAEPSGPTGVKSALNAQSLPKLGD